LLPWRETQDLAVCRASQSRRGRYVRWFASLVVRALELSRKVRADGEGVMGRVDWDRAPTARDVDDHHAEVEAEKVRQAEVRQELDAWRLEDFRRLQELYAWCLEDLRRLQELDAWCLEDLRRLQELSAEAEVRQELDVWLLKRSR